jgi:hypothetical protein
MRSSKTTAESRLAAEKANASRQVDEPEYEMEGWVTVDHTDRFVRYAFATCFPSHSSVKNVALRALDLTACGPRMKDFQPAPPWGTQNGNALMHDLIHP